MKPETLATCLTKKEYKRLEEIQAGKNPTFSKSPEENKLLKLGLIIKSPSHRKKRILQIWITKKETILLPSPSGKSVLQAEEI